MMSVQVEARLGGVRVGGVRLSSTASMIGSPPSVSEKRRSVTDRGGVEIAGLRVGASQNQVVRPPSVTGSRAGSPLATATLPSGTVISKP